MRRGSGHAVHSVGVGKLPSGGLSRIGEIAVIGCQSGVAASGTGISIKQRLSLICKLPQKPGDVAQLGEHLLCKQRVRGSSPLVSTILFWVDALVQPADLRDVCAARGGGCEYLTCPARSYLLR